ncbi:hypothetical protein V1511DRAFT_470765, partial [Dipodascopsis uninucleata]
MADLRPMTTTSKRSHSPGRVPVSLGPLETRMDEIKKSDLSPKTPTAEQLVDMKDYIDPHIFKQLPIVFPVSDISFKDLVGLPTSQLLLRSTLSTIATTAEQMIVSSLVTDHNRIFHLWTLRLVSLCLLQYQSIASAEANALAGINSSELFKTKSGLSVIPWDLRTVLITIQTNDHSQLGIVKYYALAREARMECWKQSSKATTETEIWKLRLADCGIYIASILANMRDYAAAFEQLQCMYESCPGDPVIQIRIVSAIALLHIKLGNMPEAGKWFQKVPSTDSDPIIQTPVVEAVHPIISSTLSDTASGINQQRDTLFKRSFEELSKINESSAFPQSADSQTQYVDNDISKVNIALAYLNDSRSEMARSIFSDLSKNGNTLPDLIFSYFIVDILKRQLENVSAY